MKSIIHTAIEAANNNTEIRLSNHICVITRGKSILTTNTNDTGNRVLGISVTSRHAEMNALYSLKCNTTRKKYYEKLGYLCNKSRQNNW